MTLEEIIGTLSAKKTAYAVDALSRKSEEGAYHIGYHQGIVQGYERAVQDLLKLKEQQENHGKFE